MVRSPNQFVLKARKKQQILDELEQQIDRFFLEGKYAGQSEVFVPLKGICTFEIERELCARYRQAGWAQAVMAWDSGGVSGTSLFLSTIPLNPILDILF